MKISLGIRQPEWSHNLRGVYVESQKTYLRRLATKASIA